MVLYARSDVSGVGVPVDGGGCGAFHRRPVIEGRLAKLFAIDCQPCESYLRLRLPDQWTNNRWDIPLTPDEVLQADMLEKQAKRLQQQETSERARESARSIAEHYNDPYEANLPSFLDAERISRVGSIEEPPVVDPDAVSARLAQLDDEVDPAVLSMPQLRKRCAEAGLSTGGKKVDLINRLRAEG